MIVAPLLPRRPRHRYAGPPPGRALEWIWWIALGAVLWAASGWVVVDLVRAIRGAL